MRKNKLKNIKITIDGNYRIGYNVITGGDNMFVETQKVIKVGNSLGVYLKRMGSSVWIPKQGETVTVEYNKNRIIITKGEK